MDGLMLRFMVLHPSFDDAGYLKTGTGLFINNHYHHGLEHSSILTIGRKLFSPQVLDAVNPLSVGWEHIYRSNVDYTMVNFYASQQEYRAHRDRSVFTALIFLGMGTFEGGAFELTDFDELIPFRPNTGIIIPGCVTHRAQAITCEPGNYRVSIANFIGYRQD